MHPPCPETGLYSKQKGNSNKLTPSKASYTLKKGKSHFGTFCDSMDNVVYLMTRGITLYKFILQVTIEFLGIFFFGGRGVSTLNKGLCVLVSLNCATNYQLLQWTVNHFSIKFTIYNKFYCNKGLCITYSDSEVIQSPKKQSPVKWWSNTICNQATEQQQSP